MFSSLLTGCINSKILNLYTRMLSATLPANLLKEILVNKLKCSETEASKMLQYSALESVSVVDLEKRLEDIMKTEIPVDAIKNNPWVLEAPIGEISQKLKLLQNLNLKNENRICLLQCSKHQINSLITMVKRDLKAHNESRITYLSKKLEVNPSEICFALCNRIPLTKLSFKHIKEVMNALEKHQMEKKFILNDMWVFQYNADDINKQLQKVTDAEVDYLKPWMGRCDDVIFNKLMEKLNGKQTLLGDKTVEDYLSTRLKCSVETVKSILDRYPSISKVDVRKVKKMLDCLFLNEYSETQILNALPRIMKRSVHTISNRVAELRQLGLFPCSIYILCKSRKEYAEYKSKYFPQNTSNN